MNLSHICGMNLNRNTYLLVLAFAISLCIARFAVPVSNVLTWDVFGYYLYLPAAFIYNDLFLLDHSWLDNIINQYETTATLYQAVQIENGNWVMKYSMGMAVLYAPFCFVAHLIATPMGYAADGFSTPYQVAQLIGGLVYAFVGLWFFMKVLLHFFDGVVSAILLVMIVLGTNYFQLTAFDGTLLSHNYLFSCYALLLWCTIKWHRNQKIGWAILIGLLCGLITLVRPAELVCVLIPLLWGVHSRASFIAKFQLIKENIGQLSLAVLAAIIVGLPQIIYWYAVSGAPLFYSYTNAGEGFEFMSPYIWQYLFSFRKGWFIYTPLMVFAFVGFYWLYRKNKAVFLPIFLFILLDLWIVSSWTTWWYAGGSFSARSMVPAYTLLAIPLGYFVLWIKDLRLEFRIGVLAVGFGLIALNLFQTWQFRAGIITKETMTMDYYLATFARCSVSDADKLLLLIDRTTGEVEQFTDAPGYQSRVVYNNYFDEVAQISVSGDSSGVLVMGPELPYSPGLDLAYRKITQMDHAWIRTSVNVFIPEDYSEEWPLLIVTFNHKGAAYKYRSSEKQFSNWTKGSWNTIQMDYLTPEVRSKDDNLMVYVWHRAQSPVAIDNFKIEIWDKRP
jgi:hypothetical protein